MEDQNYNTKQEKKNGKAYIISIIFTVACIYLFGPLPGAIGVVVEELLKRKLAKKNPDSVMYKVISYVIGAVVALALSVVFGIILAAF